MGNNELDNKNFLTAFSGDEFSTTGEKVIKLLAKYLQNIEKNQIKTVLPYFTPEDILKRWSGEFTQKGSTDLFSILSQVLEESNHLHHPKYIGHQCTSSLPLAALVELVSDLLNNGTAVYEMGPVNVAMEKRVIDWMAQQIGFSNNADGIFTSGGTLGNLTALLAARQIKAGYNIWKEGVKESSQLHILVSEDSHYSIKRAIGIMGLGEDSIIPVRLTKDYKMDLDDLVRQTELILKKGGKVMAVVAKACSTATGTHDQLDSIGDFCKQKNIWFHVDAAHGASALLSMKYKHLLKGISKADSVVWDAHKMLLMPALTTAVIFKNKTHSYQVFSQKASYLFEKDPEDEWYNYAHRTMECTKKMMGLKLYTCLKVLGTDFFSNYIDYTYDLTRNFANHIRNQDDFELPVPPESNIICFRYRPKNQKITDINLLQAQIRKEILKIGTPYIVQTKLRNELFLRCTLINPVTKFSDLLESLDIIRKTGARLILKK